jgi:hypothetical protein
MSVGSHVKSSANSGLFTLQLAQADKDAFSDFAALVPQAARAAQRRALNKTLRWLRTHIARAVGRQARIAIAAVRQRLKAYPVNSNEQAKLWFGVNPIEASRAGRVRQGRSGVSVAGRKYQGAFYKTVYGSEPDIWIRTASKHFRASDYPDSDVSGGGGPSSGWIAENGDRYPLAKAKISLDDVRPHFEDWSRRAHQRLLEILEQEMNFELQKYLRKSAHV